jgi:serine/threonine-protein kinase
VRELDQEEDVERRAAGAVGTVLDRKWRLDRLLGCGGMGAVYASTHRNGTRAAVKILHPEAALSPSLRRRFLREGYVANKVEHPGAVSIVDDDIDPSGNAYLVMELLHGETLESRLAREGGKLDAAEVIQIVCQVLDCLEAAHAQGIVHRDIKPGNLFLTTDGAVKVLDFGIARLTENRGKRGDTTGVQALGTPDFMPPEQARGHWDDVDARSDLFAVGAVMLFALSGRPLREAPTTNEQLLRAMTEPLPELSSLVPTVNELVAKLVDRAAAFRKEDRFPDAGAFRQAARAAYGSVASQPLERAPLLPVRPVPNGPVSGEPVAIAEQLASAEDALLSMPAASLSARSLSPTKIIGTPRRSPVLRIAAVVVTVAGALFAMTFRGTRGAPAVEPVVSRVSVASMTAAPVFAAPHGEISAVTEPSAEVPSAAPSRNDDTAAKPAPAAVPVHRIAHPSHAVLAGASLETAPEQPSPEPPPAAAPKELSHSVDLFSRRK